MPVQSSVVVEISDGENSYLKITQNQGNSFSNRFGSWVPYSYTPRIKAYTKLIEKKIYFTDTAAQFATDENNDGIFILAYYKGSKMEDLRLFPVQSSETNSFPIPAEWKKGDGYRIKGFHWESISSMIPICCEEISWEEGSTE